MITQKWGVSHPFDKLKDQQAAQRPDILKDRTDSETDILKDRMGSETDSLKSPPQRSNRRRAYITSGAAIPSKYSPRASTFLVAAHSARRDARTSPSDLSTGHCS